nr:hypothetical protein CFP56_52128 [Quercus suber]
MQFPLPSHQLCRHRNVAAKESDITQRLSVTANIERKSYDSYDRPLGLIAVAGARGRLIAVAVSSLRKSHSSGSLLAVAVSSLWQSPRCGSLITVAVLALSP